MVTNGMYASISSRKNLRSSSASHSAGSLVRGKLVSWGFEVLLALFHVKGLE